MKTLLFWAVAITSTAAICYGCGDQPHSPYHTSIAKVSDWHDTTVMNNVGFWHNEICDELYDSLDALDSISWDNIVNNHNNHYELYQSVEAAALTIEDFNELPYNSDPGKTKLYDSAYSWAKRDWTDAQWLGLVESWRTTHQLSPRITTILDSAITIFTTSLTPQSDFEGLLRSAVNDTSLTSMEKNWARMTISVARESRDYWESRSVGKRSTNSAVAAIPIMLKADLIGAAVGGLWTWLVDGETSIRKIASSAGRTAAVVSLMRGLK